jgi:hypothetical protein
MKTNLLLLRARKYGMGFLYVLWSLMKFIIWIFPRLLMLALMITPPVAGYLLPPKAPLLGAILGIMVSAYFTLLIGKSVKAIKMGKIRGLLVSIMDSIMIAGYTGLTVAFGALALFSFEGLFDKGPKGEQLWLGLIFIYVVFSLIGLFIGLILDFGEEKFIDYVDEYEADIRAKNKSWREKKRKMLLFNPIVLPFSLAGIPVKFIFQLVFEMSKVIGKELKESFQEGSKRIKTKPLT